MREDERTTHLSKNWNLKGTPIIACLEKFPPDEQEEAMNFLEEVDKKAEKIMRED